MRVSEEPVCIYLFRQNPVFTSLHLRSPESIATLTPFGPIGGHRLVFQISSQWESQKNRFSVYLFRQNPVFTSIHLRSPESIAMHAPSIRSHEGHKLLFQISSQWDSQRNRFAFISFGKNQVFASLRLRSLHVVPPHRAGSLKDDWSFPWWSKLVFVQRE